MAMRMAAVLCALLLALCGSARAEDIAADGFSFTPPEELSARLAGGEAQGGIVYAAESDDGALRLIVLCQRVKRSADTSTAALIGRLSEGEAELQEPIAVGDTEFAVSTETVEEGGRSVYFRTATAVRDGRQITFFIIDYDGAHADMPERLVKSVQWNQ